MKRLLVDTNVVIWLLFGERHRLTSRAVAALEDEHNDVAVSAATVWEIAIKRSRGRLTLPDDWMAALTGLPFDPVPISALHAAAVERLATHHHGAFDRMLVAQAVVERAALVSADRDLARYGVEIVW